MKQYEAYKDSGIQWLGDIPSHWSLQRTKRIVRLVTDNVTDHSLKKVALENIESGTGKFIETDNEFAGEGIEFHRDDILFGKLRPYLAKVYKAEFNGQSVGDIYVFRAYENSSANYLKYLFISYPIISIVDGSTYGAKMPRANWDFISNLILPVPSKAEQEVIAAYLDQKVGKIDAIITEKEAMVDQLQQYRKSLISETVTRGLDPNVPMKDSGIDWIGQIPEHWQVVKLKYTGSFDNGLTYSPNDVDEKGILVLRSSNIQNQRLAFEDNVYVKSAPDDLLVRAGDIIICSRNGSANLVGKCAFIETDLDNTSFGAFMMRYRPSILGKYAFYAFQSVTDSYKGLYSTSTINQLTKGVIDQMYVVIPPIQEQQEIATCLDTRLTTIDLSISELQSQIEDLRAYKSSVITEAVTGKVDLRDWKPSEVTA